MAVLSTPVRPIRPKAQEEHGGATLLDFCTLTEETTLAFTSGVTNTSQAINEVDLLSDADCEGPRLFHPDGSVSAIAQPTTLYGINDDVPFFTSAQVFYTPTGFRAVDAAAARRLLPDLEIGQLSFGHIVYRLNRDNETHNPVPVTSINSLQASKRRNGVTFGNHPASYYANGYRVLSVQPSMTVTSIASALSRLPRAKRIKALQGLTELDPLFQQVGAGGVGRLLEQELSEKDFRLVDPPSLSRRTHRPWSRPFTSVRRTYNLMYRGKTAFPPPGIQYNLPVVRLFEGVLSIDGHIQTRNKIDTLLQVITWSRELPAGWFEHGRIRMFEHGLSGDGVVFLSQDKDSKKVTDGVTDHIAPVRVVKHFSSKDTLNRDREGDGTEDLFEMVFDMDPWPKGTERTKPTLPFDMGSISFETQDIGGDDGLSAPIVKIPVLDQLCEAINKASGGDIKLSSLYVSTMNIAGRSPRTAIVDMKNASLVAQLADGFDKDAPYNLTFKKQLGSDIVLPILFQEFQVDLSDDGLSGAIFRFSPEMRGCIGQRHLLISNNAPSNSTIQTRLSVSQQLLKINARGTNIKLRPAPVTDTFRDLGPMSVEDLVQLDRCDEPKIHTTTQDLVYNAMLYHMKEKDRKDVLQKDKPTDLPWALGDGLDEKYKTWLANIYGPAYICNMLTQVKPADSTGWRYNFTYAEAIKIRYFWSGRGRTCLASSPEYNSITQIALNTAMLTLYPRLQIYAEQGNEWAAQTVACLSNYTCLRSLAQAPIEGGTNYANKFSNILSVLDLAHVHTNEYFESMYAYSLYSSSRTTYIDTTPNGIDDSKTWLKDCFVRIGVAVIEGQPWLEADMRQSLLSDIQQVEHNLKLPSDPPAEQRMQAILATQVALVDGLGASMSPLEDFLSSEMVAASRAQLGGVQGAMNAIKGSSGFTWISNAYDRVMNALFPDGSQNATLLKGLLAIGSAAKYLYSALTGFSEWNTDDPVQKSLLVEKTLQNIVSTLGKSFEIWNTWKMAPISRARLAYAAYLDEFGDVEMKTFVSNIATDLEPRTGPNPVQHAISERLYGSGEPNPSSAESGATTASEVGFDVPLTDPEVEVLAKEVSAVFNVAKRWLGAATIILTMGTVVSMSFDLAEQWGDLNTFGKTLSVINIAVTALSIVCNEVIADALVWAGFIAAEGTMATALPGIGFVLAAVGLVIGLLMALFQTKKPPPPPPLNSYEDFILNEGRPLVTTLDDQRMLSLTYSMPIIISPYGPMPNQFQITAMNESDNIVSIGRATIGLLSGTDDGSLFTNSDFKMVRSNDISRDNDGNMYTELNDDVRATITANPRGAGSSWFELAVTGTSTDNNPKGLLKLLPGFGFRVNISGMISTFKSSVLEITEGLVEPDDKSYKLVTIQKLA